MVATAQSRRNYCFVVQTLLIMTSPEGQVSPELFHPGLLLGFKERGCTVAQSSHTPTDTHAKCLAQFNQSSPMQKPFGTRVRRLEALSCPGLEDRFLHHYVGHFVTLVLNQGRQQGLGPRDEASAGPAT